MRSSFITISSCAELLLQMNTMNSMMAAQGGAKWYSPCSFQLQFSASAGMVLLLALLASFSIGICPQLPASISPSALSSTSFTLDSNGLMEDYYGLTCPRALNILNETLTRAISRNATVAPGLVRLAFHDCFVQGCDGSVLLTPELEDGPNKNSLRGLEAINDVKQALEAECPNTVSCADIIVLAARHAVVQSGGPSYPLTLGRRDGVLLNGSLASAELPNPKLNISSILSKFRNKGFNETDIVSLLGAHSIGEAKCLNFGERLCNQDGTSLADPRLNASLYIELVFSCIPGDPNDSSALTPCNVSPVTAVSLDSDTPNAFDNCFFKNVALNRGVLGTDAALLEDTTTEALVQAYAQNQDLFFQDFKRSMIKLSNLGVLSGIQGEIRRNCSVQN